MGYQVGHGGTVPKKHDSFAVVFHGGNKARKLSFYLADVDGNHSQKGRLQNALDQI
jgi:hypothetical protein